MPPFYLYMRKAGVVGKTSTKASLRRCYQTPPDFWLRQEDLKEAALCPFRSPRSFPLLLLKSTAAATSAEVAALRRPLRGEGAEATTPGESARLPGTVAEARHGWVSASVSATVSPCGRQSWKQPRLASVTDPIPAVRSAACSPHPGAEAADRRALQILPAAAAPVQGQDVFQVHLHPAARRGSGKATGNARHARPGFTSGLSWGTLVFQGPLSVSLSCPTAFVFLCQIT